VIDFGKNTYQSEIMFKFDCISPDFILIVARSFAARAPGWFVGKDQQTGQSLIYTGDGSPKSPFFQVKLSADRIVLWVGWNVSYTAWTEWRGTVVKELLSQSDNFPSYFVAQLVTHASIAVPADKSKKGTESPELAPLIEFSRRYVSEEYMSKGAGHSIFSNDAGTRIIETQVAGNPATQDNTFNYLHRWTAINPRVSVEKNLEEHFELFDNLFEKYNSALSAPLIKKP